MARGVNRRRTATTMGAVVLLVVVLALLVTGMRGEGAGGASSSVSGVRSRTKIELSDATEYDPLGGPVPVGTRKVSMGGPIMPHLGNETIKAELGRASWKLLHTILARYPERPTAEEREALSSYIYLFSRVYPCGECAAHFQKLLKQFPPQTSGRIAASQWGCHIHNQVNARLGKEIFDCNEIGERYKCGCEETDVEKDGGKSEAQSKEKNAVSEFSDVEERLRGIKIESKEGVTRGG
ncbi:ERV/ALR sulfhydryl oxidase domain-containing protein [Lipomyces oligophaga]|uniref:ERV/ALR sulfhydryl oxidase domain-containing protein n=1 Tax=Lipomyces oligophaga TaxID=45792 RepID=UPI0034CEEC77